MSYSDSGQQKKHPLNSSWTLWYFSTPKGYKPKDYSEYLRKVYNFNFVEDFWCVYNHITKPSKLKPSDAMMMFRNEVKPEYEDPVNRPGGEWRVSFPFNQFSRSIDAAWENLLMWAIGEMFSHSEEVSGVYLNIKKGKDRGVEFRLSVWTRHSSDDLKEQIMSLGQELKKCLGCHPDHIPRVEYRKHADYYERSGSRRPKYTIEPTPGYHQRSRGNGRGGHRGGGRGGYRGGGSRGGHRGDSRGHRGHYGGGGRDRGGGHRSGGPRGGSRGGSRGPPGGGYR